MALQFKIQITGIEKPPVWRRVLVADQVTLDVFHQVIQAAFGWENCHLYRFSQLAWKSDPIYKIPDEYDDQTVRDSRVVKLSEIFIRPNQTFTYLYDFGDDWIHHIILEEISDEKITHPLCTDGKSACPPEDCGGPPRYSNLVEALNDPKHQEHREIRKWLGLRKGEQWDVNAFDINAANVRCSKISFA
ncbi:MAG: plasmid pRiA4b family protein [Mucilaginibacter sp.]|nr:plasmid pRiA4b family protein [Mucilaginibacter sp.]